MSQVPTLTLHDGKTIPQCGLGVWQIDAGDTARVVSEAIGLGYRLIDGAVLYGNEEGMGEGIRRSGVDRGDLFVTSKVWCDMQGYDLARRSIEGSLKRTGLDRLDLMLIHWPAPAKDLYVETWKALIDAKADGQVTSIGVSNFEAAHLDRIIDETGEVPVLNQIEVNPEMQQPAMRAADRERGIVTQSWTPLGQGRSFDAAPIRAVAEREGVSPAQVVLRWHVEIGNAVISRSTKADHLAQNLDIFGFELTAEDMAAIETLDADDRTGPNPNDFSG